MKNIKKFENFSIVEAGRWYQGKIVSEPCPLIPRNNQGQWNLIDLEHIPFETTSGRFGFGENPSVTLYNLMHQMWNQQNQLTP